jgi:hypothetical protein
MTPLMKHIEDPETWIHCNTVRVGICENELLRQHPSVRVCLCELFLGQASRGVRQIDCRCRLRLCVFRLTWCSACLGI